MYFVYIIQSDLDKSWYDGFSEDPPKRLLAHNAGESRYTKAKLPWRMIFCREFKMKGEALKFERYLKRTRNKAYIKKAYSAYFRI